MRAILVSIVIFFLAGCGGYTPTARIVDNIMDDSVFVDVLMSKTDPQNTVAIKDSIRSGIVKRLGKQLAPKESAKTYIIAKINSINFSELSYDPFGYGAVYKAELSVNFKTKLKDGSIANINTVGDHDFRVSGAKRNAYDLSSVISDKDRFEAIENASTQAFDEFISALAIKGFKINEAKSISR